MARSPSSGSAGAVPEPKSPGGDSGASELPFEQALERLEQIVGRLEEGDLELEESLSVFEEGVRLVQSCSGQLDVAERRIEVLTREGADWIARPFEGGDSGDQSG